MKHGHTDISPFRSIGLLVRGQGIRSMIVALSVFILANAPVLAHALAQDEAQAALAPRQPGVRILTSAWVGYAAMVLILGLVMMISLKASKRGQQKP